MKMSFLMRKNVIFLNLHKCRFFMKNFKNENLYLLNRPCRRRNIVSSHQPLATVAHNHKLNDDYSTIKGGKFGSSAFIKEIDHQLTKIDWYIKRTGRTTRSMVESVFSKVKNTGLSTPTHGLYFLRCCGRILEEAPSKRVQLANEIWSELCKLGCSFETSHYNALLKIYVDNGHHFSPTDFLSLLDASQIEPDKVTYLYLIMKYCNDGNLTGASEILEFMKEKKLPVNEAVFNSLIKGHIKIQDLSGAWNILDVMRGSNLSPTADTITALACGYAEKGDIKEMKSVLMSAMRNGLTISHEHFLQLIDVAATNHHVHEIMELRENFREYKQECINLAINLIHRGIDDVAYKLIQKSSLPNSHFNSGTNIFIKQLIKAETEVEKIIHYCDDIFEQELNDLIHLNAAKAAIDHENFCYATALFEAMLKKGIPVRIHYFLPMLSYYKEKSSFEGICWTLRKMFEVGLCADFMIYCKYVAPCVGMMHPNDIIPGIQGSGQSVAVFVDSLFEFYCYHGKLDYALHLTQNHPVRINANFDIKRYLSLYKDFRQNSVYFQVLNYILKNPGLKEEDAEDLRGRYLAAMLEANNKVYDAYLKNQDSKQFHFGERSLSICEEILSKKEKYPMLLDNLKRLEEFHSEFSPKREMTIEEENEHLNLLKDRRSRQFFLMNSLLFHIKRKNVNRVLELLSSYEEGEGFDIAHIPPSVCSKLIDLFIGFNDIKMVEKLMAALKKNHPSYKLDTVKILDYAALLIKFSKIAEAVDIINTECKELRYFIRREGVLKSMKRFLNAAVETGNIELVRNLQNLLLHHSKVLGSIKSFLEPLIKVHLFWEDMQNAVEEYRNCVVNYKVSPCLSLLLKKCIVTEDHLNLEKVIDLTIAYIGKKVAFHELAVSFVETGRLQQALKVIQNLGEEADTYLEELCCRMFNENKVLQLEEFIFLSKDLHHTFSREKIYYYLMKLYDVKKDHEKALVIWKRLQEENIVPSAETEKLFSSLLNRNGTSVPLTHPEKENSLTESSADVSSSHTHQLVKEKFLDNVNKKNIDAAVFELEKMKKGHIRLLNFQEISQFIDLLVEKKRVSDLLSNVQVMSYIIEYPNDILKPLLEKYSEIGDVESLTELTRILPDFTLKKIKAYTFRCKALISSGRHEDLLLEIEKSVSESFGGKIFFSIYPCLELLNMPNLRERVIKVAEKYLEKKIDLPIAAVGAHYFINENYDKACELFELHPGSVEKVDSVILRHLRQTGNLAMGMQYVKLINQLALVKDRTKERAYGAVLNILVEKEMYDEALVLVKESEEHQVTLHKFYQSTLMTLKTALERQNKPVPFNISVEEFCPERSDSE